MWNKQSTADCHRLEFYHLNYSIKYFEYFFQKDNKIILYKKKKAAKCTKKSQRIVLSVRIFTENI